jgi:hypothetical protein
MNERINKLWTKVCQEEMPELDVTCMTPQRQQKFTELIVRECVSVAMEQYDETLPWGGVEQVKEHFGVEE